MSKDKPEVKPQTTKETVLTDVQPKSEPKPGLRVPTIIVDEIKQTS